MGSEKNVALAVEAPGFKPSEIGGAPEVASTTVGPGS